MAHSDRTTPYRQKLDRQARTAEKALERLRAEWRAVNAEPPSVERDVSLRAIENAARAVKLLKTSGVAA